MDNQEKLIKAMVKKIGLSYDDGRINQQGQLVFSIGADSDSPSNEFGKMLDKLEKIEDDDFWKFDENSTLSIDSANMLYQYELANAQFNFIADFVADTYILIVTMFKDDGSPVDDDDDDDEELPENFRWYDFED